MKLPFVIVCVPAFLLSVCRGETSFYTTIDEETGIIRHLPAQPGFPPEPWVNMVKVEYFQNKTGWNYLNIYSNPMQDDITVAYAAGHGEGTVDDHKHHLIKQHVFNTVGDKCQIMVRPLSPLCKKLKAWLETNFQYMYEQIEALSGHHPLWHQVKLYLAQLHGMVDGYDVIWEIPPRDRLHIIDNVLHPIVLLNLAGDLEDLEAALMGEDYNKKPLGSGSCSALIKLLFRNKDLLVAQDTWNDYGSMLRFLKSYDFAYKPSLYARTLVPGRKMTFSSYPGVITSADDFYTISSGLSTLETTIGNSDPSRWKYVKPNGTLLESIRSMAANRLAWSGKEWVDWFSQHNSGTYNNQWMIVDYKLFWPGLPLRNGTLYVLEQIPGMIEYRDNTDILEKQRYWPSYNVASFPRIFNASGQQKMVEKYGNWFSYEHTPRAKIFRRDQGKVKDMDSMMNLMRSNNFTRDPLSRCNCTPPYSAENAISARSDLNPVSGTYPFGALGHRPHGGIDAKITNSSLVRDLLFVAVSGPTDDGDLQPFQWSKSDFDKTVRHYAHPDLWLFKPVIKQFFWFGKIPKL